ncbi:hypothetical protein MBLNU459_g3940t1 [Dothideomycetes sp. NU459]
MADAQPPLSWETSARSHPQQSSTLPPEVVTCLENARFLHLATCTELQPHVSLMNYTYLPSHPFASAARPAGPIIIMTTNPSSKKTDNLVVNPNVSLLVHDWVSHRPPTNPRGSSPDGRRTAGPAARSSLATLLMGMNTSAMGSISATINGTAEVLPQGSDEERWCKTQHLENNTFDDAQNQPGQSILSSSPSQGLREDGGRGTFIEDDDVRVVVVRIKEGRIADWKGGVKDWVLAPEPVAAGDAGLVNGI